MRTEVSITSRVTILELKEDFLGMRSRAARFAERLISQLIDEFEQYENDGAEFECLELTAGTFKPRDPGE